MKNFIKNFLGGWVTLYCILVAFFYTVLNPIFENVDLFNSIDYEKSIDINLICLGISFLTQLIWNTRKIQ